MSSIRQYFLNGTLPEKGTVCEVEGSIFGGEGELQAQAESLSEEDRVLFEATNALHRKVGVRRLFL
jgi:hypothetical protein